MRLYAVLRRAIKPECMFPVEPIGPIMPTIMVHGGVGKHDLTKLAPNKMKDLKIAAMLGYRLLKTTSIVNAVEDTMNFLEESPEFNIGYGSVKNAKGEIEMDASIMCGRNLRTGAVGGVQNIAYPTTLARSVMDYTPHVLLAGNGTKSFARVSKIPILQPGALASSTTEHIRNFGGEIGNAGVIAINEEGHVVAATGNAGVAKKPPGSLTESARIGCGIYADNRVGAVAVAGNSQELLRSLLAFRICKCMMHKMSANDAIKNSLHHLYTTFKTNAGAIVISSTGDVAVAFSTRQMAWAYQRGDEMCWGLKPGQRVVERVCG